MLEGSRWECALGHGRSEKRPNNAPFHKKGELNNKKMLVAKVNELAEEIKALETQVAEESVTASSEKVQAGQKQPVKIDTTKLTEMISEDFVQEAPKLPVDDQVSGFWCLLWCKVVF